MNRLDLLACGIAAALTFAAPAGAQTASGGTGASAGTTVQLGGSASAAAQGAASMLPEIEVRQSSSGTAYISGGASTDIRDLMDKRRSEFPLKLSVSSCSGEYVVAETFSLSGPRGEFLNVNDVGPIIMTKPPASGKITARATYKGETQSRTFTAPTRQTVNICFKTRG